MALDAEMIDKFRNGELDTDTLSADDLDALMAVIEAGGNEPPTPAPAEDPKPEDKGNEPPVPAEDPKPEDLPPAPPEEVKPPKPKTLDEFKEDRFRLSSELNKERQIRQQLERKLAEQQQARPQVDVDVWDTELQKKNHADLQEALRIANEAKAELNRMQNERKLEQVYAETQAVADEFGMGINVRSLDTKYKELAANVENPPTMEEFAQAIGDKEQAGKYFDLIAVDRHKRENNFGKLRTAFRDLELDEKYKRAIGQQQQADAAKQAEVEANRQAIANGKAATPTLPASYSGKDTAMSLEWAMNWLEKKGGNESSWTAEDRITFGKIAERYLQ